MLRQAPHQRLRWTAGAGLAALALLVSLAGAQVAAAVPIQAPIDSLTQDAGEYARAYGVPLDEAMRRLRAQEHSVAATDRIAVLYRDRLAGIVIEHVPAYRIVVLLTGTDPVPDETVQASDMIVPIVYRTGAAATRDAVVAAIRAHQAEIRAALPHPPGLGADPRTGGLVVMANGADGRDADGSLTARFAALTGVPVRIVPIDRPPVDMAVEGGARVVGTDPADGRHYACTTGFVVGDGARSAIVTAAHCPDTLDYLDPAGGRVPLDFVGQWGWGYQDVQVNVAPGPLAPLFFADTAKTVTRPVATWRNRTSTRVGDFVCHRGERTGYSCATVAMVDFAPAGDLCGGACLPTWVAVEGPTCKGGDSGAPVFVGETAFGIVKGGTYRADGSCLYYYYMSTDYLPPSWSLAHR